MLLAKGNNLEEFVKVEKIFNDEERSNLLGYYNSLEPVHWHQQYNLFEVERRDVPGTMRFSPEFEKLSEYSGLKTMAHYFLKYGEGSFARAHEDNDTSLTIVTLLDSKDLVGGEAICKLPYQHRPRPADKKVSRSGPERQKPPYNREIINYVIDAKEGDSIVYGPSLRHSVSLVTQGHRIVLISWFKE